MRALRAAIGCLGVLTASLVGACGGRTIGVHGDSEVGDGAAACRCSPSVSGDLRGSPVTYDRAAYGVDVTWGTHAHPVSPQAAFAISLQLSDAAITCTDDDSEATFSGPHLVNIRIQSARQELRYGWVEPISGWDTASLTGEICFTALPIRDEEPLGWPVEVSAEATGCLNLRFSSFDGKQPLGEVAGGFVASHCAALDSAMGE